jgi:ComF family protein
MTRLIWRMAGGFKMISSGQGTGRFGGLIRRAGIEFGNRLREIVVPAGCIACNRPSSRQGALCFECWQKLHFVERPYCEVLGTPFAHDLGEGAVSTEAIADPPPFDRLRCAVVYGDLARALVSGLKFSDRTDLAPWMARWMRVAGRELIDDCTLAVPVPLHWRRLQRRRYNQSAELARAICRGTELQFSPLVLVRSRATRRQVGLSAGDRLRNVQGAFRVPAELRPVVEGRRVLLVDDVHTSGATVRACARALRRAGAAGVDVLVFASVVGEYI